MTIRDLTNLSGHRNVFLAMLLFGATFWFLSPMASPAQDVVYRCPSRTPIAIEVSPKGRRIAIRTGLAEISFFSVSDWAIARCGIRARYFTFVDTNTVAVISVNDRIYMVDPSTSKSLFSFPMPGRAMGRPVSCGGYICIPTGPESANYTEPTTVLVMDVKGHVIRKVLTVATSVSPATRVLYASPDNRWLVALGAGRAIVYRSGTWRKVADIKDPRAGDGGREFLTLCTFSSNGKVMLVGNHNSQQTFETGSWKRKEVLPSRGHPIVSAMPRPGSDGFLFLLSDGSLRDYRSDQVVVEGTDPYGPAGRCNEGLLGPGGLFLTGWENGNVRRQFVKLR